KGERALPVLRGEHRRTCHHPPQNRDPFLFRTSGEKLDRPGLTGVAAQVAFALQRCEMLLHRLQGGDPQGFGHLCQRRHIASLSEEGLDVHEEGLLPWRGCLTYHGVNISLDNCGCQYLPNPSGENWI